MERDKGDLIITHLVNPIPAKLCLLCSAVDCEGSKERRGMRGEALDIWGTEHTKALTRN